MGLVASLAYKPAMHSEYANPLQDADWNKRILHYETANIFHSAQWARVLTESYGYSPQYATFTELNGTVGILPIMEVQSVWTGRRGVCLPFSDECVPLLSGTVTLESALESVRALGLQRQWDYFELRGFGEPGPLAVQTDQFLTHNLLLEQNEERQQHQLRDSTRRNIRRALKEGVEVEHLQSLDAVDAFYALHSRTRRRHGLPPQPLRFFHLIHKHLIEPGLGMISLARYSGRWIAGAVFLHFGSRAVYKFGASDPEFQRVRANNLLMWQAIRQLHGKGIAQLSFGRSDRDDAGLLQFKRGWGARETELPYYRIGLRKSIQSSSRHKGTTGRLRQQFVQRLPLSFLRLAGGLMYKHLG